MEIRKGHSHALASTPPPPQVAPKIRKLNGLDPRLHHAIGAIQTGHRTPLGYRETPIGARGLIEAPVSFVKHGHGWWDTHPKNAPLLGGHSPRPIEAR